VPAIETLRPSYKSEIATAGVVRIPASKQCFLEQFKDIASFIGGSRMVVEVGKFSDPPASSDLEKLTLDPKDIDALQNCRVGACGVKLPADFIEHFGEVDWASPDSGFQAQSLFRQLLLNYVRAYLARDGAALAEYRDKRQPVSLATRLRGMIDASMETSRALDGVAQFMQYVADYPANPPGNLERFVYWSKLHFGFKPTITVSDVLIDHQPGQLLMASKQIYASHYFNGSLSLIVALDDPSQPGMYLAYINRSRIDVLGRSLGPIRRVLVGGRVRGAFRRELEQVSRKVEASCKPPKG
jgi:hypothetical protein